MRIGIDASNISSGGGLNHLVELLNAVCMEDHGITSIIVWSNQKTLNQISQKPNLFKKGHPYLNQGILKRWIWQKFIFEKELVENCDVLFVPGSSYSGRFRPFITMNRNLLPFDLGVRKSYGFSMQAVRLLLLEKLQAKTFKAASGVIFLSENALNVTEETMGEKITKSFIIPHGISQDFFKEPRKTKPLTDYSKLNPFRITYTSTITVYKYQWKVIEAVFKLRKAGYCVVLDLIGKITTKKGHNLLNEAVAHYDPKGEFVHIHGKMNHKNLREHYEITDLFLFASACETFGQILLEAMAFGMPIVCSNRSAMPEILEDGGIYFDPENTDSIVSALKNMIDSQNLRYQLSLNAWTLAKAYSWERCAEQTFQFITEIYQKQCNS